MSEREKKRTLGSTIALLALGLMFLSVVHLLAAPTPPTFGARWEPSSSSAPCPNGMICVDCVHYSRGQEVARSPRQTCIHSGLYEDCSGGIE